MNVSTLQIKNLSIGYNTPLVEGINLSLGSNEFVTIMGENGCGKTTFIDCLMGIKKPLSGEISFWKKKNSGATSQEIHQKVGWVISQKESYPLHLKIGTYLKVLAEVYPSWNWELCKKLCSSFELTQNKKLQHLSMGENSKLRLVKALSFEPSLLILDELTANLSPSSKEILTRAIIELFSEKKMSILYVCHSNEEAVRLSDRIFVMTKNGLQEQGMENA